MKPKGLMAANRTQFIYLFFCYGPLGWETYDFILYSYNIMSSANKTIPTSEN